MFRESLEEKTSEKLKNSNDQHIFVNFCFLLMLLL